MPPGGRRSTPFSFPPRRRRRVAAPARRRLGELSPRARSLFLAEGYREDEVFFRRGRRREIFLARRTDSPLAFPRDVGRARPLCAFFFFFERDSSFSAARTPLWRARDVVSVAFLSSVFERGTQRTRVPHGTPLLLRAPLDFFFPADGGMRAGSGLFPS